MYLNAQMEKFSAARGLNSIKFEFSYAWTLSMCMWYVYTYGYKLYIVCIIWIHVYLFWFVSISTVCLIVFLLASNEIKSQIIMIVMMVQMFWLVLEIKVLKNKILIGMVL